MTKLERISDIVLYAVQASIFISVIIGLFFPMYYEAQSYSSSKTTGNVQH